MKKEEEEIVVLVAIIGSGVSRSGYTELSTQL